MRKISLIIVILMCTASCSKIAGIIGHGALGTVHIIKDIGKEEVKYPYKYIDENPYKVYKRNRELRNE